MSRLKSHCLLPKIAMLFSPLFPQGTILIGRREEGAVCEGAAVVRQINLQIKGATYHLICKLICRLIFI